MITVEEKYEAIINDLIVKRDRYKNKAKEVDMDEKNCQGDLLRDVYTNSFKAYTRAISNLRSDQV